MNPKNGCVEGRAPDNNLPFIQFMLMRAGLYQMDIQQK